MSSQEQIGETMTEGTVYTTGNAGLERIIKDLDYNECCNI